MWAGAGTSALAQITFTGHYTGAEDGSANTATVIFGLTGTTLDVTLENTTATQVGKATDILTALFFNVAGGSALTPVSALLPSGNGVFNTKGTAVTQPTLGDVGNQWGYVGGGSALSLAAGMSSANQGISSSGLGPFGSGNFPSGRTDSAALDGINYGISGPGGASYSDGLQGTGQGNHAGAILIESEASFTLKGFSGSLSDISDVSFQYGTALGPFSPGHPTFTPGVLVPEPTTVLAGALLLLPFGASTLRIVRKSRTA